MADKWYNSDIGAGLCLGAVFLGFGLGASFVARGCAEYQRAENEKQYRLQTADLNNNGIPDRFYTINDKIAVVELDGRPVSELYLGRPSE